MLRHDRAEDVLALIGLAAVVVLLFFDVIFLGNSLGTGDLPAYHFPLEKTVRDLIDSGHFPWWDRLVEAGQPIAANPAYELWYPLEWIVLLPSFVLAFKLHIVIHYLLAAFGMYALCRTLGFRAATAFIAGTAFAAGGPLISTSGYLPFLFSLSWIPWVLCFAWRYHRDGKKSDLALASAAFAMQVLIGEPVMLVESAVVLLGAAIVLRRFRVAVAIILIGCALGAVQLLPAIDHARDSVRSIPLDYAAVSNWSLSVARPLELFVASKSIAPRRFVGPDRPYVPSIYLGLAIAILALVGFVRRLRGWWAVAIFAAASYVIALGSHTPLLHLLYEAHVFSSIRYPEKFFLGVLVVLIVFAAAAAERVLDQDPKAKRAALAAAAVVAVATILCAVFSSPRFVQWTWCLASPAPFPLVAIDRMEWIGTAIRAAIFLAVLAAVPRTRLAAALVAFVVADLLLANAGTVLRVSDRFYADAPPLLRQLPGPGERLFHEVAFDRALGLLPTRGALPETRWLLRNEMIPYIPAAWGRATAMSYDYDETTLFASRRLRVAGDIARTRGLRSWPLRFMALSNAPWRTVPLDPQTAIREAGGDLENLTMVRVVREPIEAARYVFAQELIPCTDVYDCTARLDASRSQRVALLPPSFPAGAVGDGRVLRVVEKPSSADLEVEVVGRRSALLTMSVTFHKYWRASIDGREATIIPANLAYQALFVPPGRHRIHLGYSNPLVFLGAAVTGLALVALIGVVAMEIVAQKKSPAPGGAASPMN